MKSLDAMLAELRRCEAAKVVEAVVQVVDGARQAVDAADRATAARVGAIEFELKQVMTQADTSPAKPSTAVASARTRRALAYSKVPGDLPTSTAYETGETSCKTRVRAVDGGVTTAAEAATAAQKTLRARDQALDSTRVTREYIDAGPAEEHARFNERMG